MKIIAIIDGILLAIYLLIKRKWKRSYSEQAKKHEEDCRTCLEENENRKEKFLYNQK